MLVMPFNHNGNINIQTNDGTKFENVTDFKYLGALIRPDGKFRKRCPQDSSMENM